MKLYMGFLYVHINIENINIGQSKKYHLKLNDYVKLI